MLGLQELSIRLYMDKDLQVQYSNNPELILKKFNLELKNAKYLPEVSDSAFQVESFGRRFLVAREIGKRFNRFFKAYLNLEKNDFRRIVESEIFSQFLSSDYYFTNKYCLNHYTDIGKGYENITKFFSFAYAYADDYVLQDILLTEVSAHLSFESNFSDCFPFNDFKKGIYFSSGENHYIVKSNKKLRLSAKPSGYKHFLAYFGSR